MDSKTEDGRLVMTCYGHRNVKLWACVSSSVILDDGRKTTPSAWLEWSESRGGYKDDRLTVYLNREQLIELQTKLSEMIGKWDTESKPLDEISTPKGWDRIEAD